MSNDIYKVIILRYKYWHYFDMRIFPCRIFMGKSVALPFQKSQILIFLENNKVSKCK